MIEKSLKVDIKFFVEFEMKEYINLVYKINKI